LPGQYRWRVDVSETKGQEFSEASAHAALVQAAAGIELDVSEAHLLRLGENAVFELGDVVARVVRSGADAEDVRRAIQVSRWLKDQGIAAVEALDVTQPVPVDGLIVTFWRSLGDSEKYGSTADLARLLRDLHKLMPPIKFALGHLDPFERATRRVSAAPISGNDYDFLEQRLVQLRQAYAELVFELPTTVIHDDASVGNVLVDQENVARLIDLDGICIGPPEWDLIQTAIYYDRYGWHTRAEYETFCHIYGFDVMRWAGYETLADIREFLMVTWMSQNAGQDERTAAEVAKRIQALRTGASRRDWQPF
jgi:Ser/Thr protein kinase RdoA (MazF antagonist)